LFVCLLSVCLFGWFVCKLRFLFPTKSFCYKRFPVLSDFQVIGALVLFAKTTTKQPGYAGPPFSEDKSKASSLYGVPSATGPDPAQSNVCG
jgi:hypothetical protein